MADRIIEEPSDDVPEIPDLFEKIALYALEEGKSIMAQGQTLVPFTVLAIKDHLFTEKHEGDSADACYGAAQHTVEGARGADAYAFCYDGYVETDGDDLDVIIAEGGLPGDEDGFAIGYLYQVAEDGTITFEDEAVFIGDAPNFMANLKESDEYDHDEIEQKYTELIDSEEEQE